MNAGFLGYHLAKRLASRPDHQLYCVDNFLRGERDALFEALVAMPHVHLIQFSLRASRFYPMAPSRCANVVDFGASKLVRLTGFAPAYTLDEGLAETARFYLGS